MGVLKDMHVGRGSAQEARGILSAFLAEINPASLLGGCPGTDYTERPVGRTSLGTQSAKILIATNKKKQQPPESFAVAPLLQKSSKKGRYSASLAGHNLD